MKKYILIQNDGEIETNSFELIGASTKRNDSTKIGFFGSGLKYSIAFMMRHKIDFKIYSGLNEVEFSVTPEKLKEQSFDRICINGKPTSYTTTMGPTWEFQWYVLREIYCNAVDEGSCQMIKSTEIVEPSLGKTRIYIELTGDLQKVINDWDAYFSDEREPLFTTPSSVYTSHLDSKVSSQSIKVFSKTNGVLFRKGIKVYEDDKMQYDYDCEHVQINEDRSAKYGASLSYGIVSMMAMLVNEKWAISILRDSDCSEYSALRTTSNYSSVSERWVELSEQYLLVVKERSGKYAQKISESEKETLLIPEGFAASLKKAHSEINILGMGKILGDYAMDEIELTPKMQFLLKEVTAALEEMGYNVPYHVKAAEFKSEKVLGRADIETKTIFIADKTFEKGRREIALTLMEESEHIKSGAEDETRQFQDHIFSKWLTYMEEKSALFL